MARTAQERRVFRKKRVRGVVTGTQARPRLSVYRSLKHLHVQLIDDISRKTVAAVSTKEPSVLAQKIVANLAGARRIGELLAERATAQQVESVVFDRGSFQYHGQVKAIADGARAGGLKF